MQNTNGAISFDAYIQTSDFKKQIDEMNRRIMGLGDTAGRESASMKRAFASVTTGLTGMLSVAALAGFGQKLIEVRGEFQKFEAVLTNTLGSQKQAVDSMQMLTDIASRTPFQLDSLTEAYVSLVNQGFKPSREEIIKLGDLASSTGKDFGQLSEALLDAQTGEFERLKQFGIKAKVSGDQISFSFKGATTTIENSGEAIRKYILGLGDMKGVKGSTEAISKTLVGQVSNLQDAITNMFNQIGEGSEGLLSGAVGAASYLVANYEAVGKVLATLVITFGAYKAAVIAHTIISAAAANATAGLTIAEQLHMTATIASARAQALLNKTMLANPYVLLATLVIGLGSAMWALHDSTTAAEQAQEIYNKKKEEAAALEEKHRGEIEKLISTATDQALADLERVSALETLKQKYPEIFEKYDTESIKLADLLKLKKELSEVESKENAKSRQNAYDSQKKQVERIANAYRDAGNTPGVSSVTLSEMKKELDVQRELLKKFDKDIQTDRVNSWIANIGAQTDLLLNIELMARKRALFSIDKNGAESAQIYTGPISGTFKAEELRAQTATIENELKKRSAATTNYTQLQKKATEELSVLKKELVVLKGKNLPEDELNKQLAEINGKIDAAKKKLKSLEGEGEGADAGTKEKAPEVDYTEILWNMGKAADDKIAELDKSWSDYMDHEEELWRETAAKEVETFNKKNEAISDALSQTATLQEKLYKIEEEFAAKRKTLTDAKPEDLSTHLDILEGQKQEAIQKLAEETISTEQATYDELIQMGRKELTAYIEKINKKIAAVKKLGGDTVGLEKELEDATKALRKSSLADGLGEASQILGSMSGLARGLDDDLGNLVDTAAELAGSLSTAIQGFSTGNIVQGISGSIGALGAIQKAYTYFEDEADKQKSYDALSESIERLNALLERQLQLINNVYGTERIEAYQKAFEKLYNEIHLTAGAIMMTGSGNPGLNYIFSESSYFNSASFNKLSYIEKINAIEKANRDGITRLMEDIARGRVEGSEEMDLLLQDYADDLQKYEELKREYEEYLTGTTSSAIVDSIAEGFANGKDSAADFADTFEELMKNAMLQSFKIKYLEEPLTKWYEDFALRTESDGVLTAAELALSKAEYDAIIDSSKEGWDNLEQVTGVDPSSSGANQLTGAVKGITEESANIIAGQMNAIRMYQAQGLQVMNQNLMANQETAMNTRQLLYLQKIYDIMNTPSGSSLGGSGKTIG